MKIKIKMNTFISNNNNKNNNNNNNNNETVTHICPNTSTYYASINNKN